MSHKANIGQPRRQITDKTALLRSAAAQTLIAQSFTRKRWKTEGKIEAKYHA